MTAVLKYIIPVVSRFLIEGTIAAYRSEPHYWSMENIKWEVCWMAGNEPLPVAGIPHFDSKDEADARAADEQSTCGIEGLKYMALQVSA